MKKTGFTLIEMLVVVGIFAIIGVVSAQSLLSIFRNSEKSDSSVVVRENVQHAFGVIERELRSAKSLDSCTSTTVSTTTIVDINYTDADNIPRAFSCYFSSASGGISQNSLPLTSSNIQITNCSATCTATALSEPGTLDLDVSAKRSQTQNGVTNTEIDMNLLVRLRSSY